MYVPLRLAAARSYVFVLRGRGNAPDAATVVPLVSALDPAIAVNRFATLENVLATSYADLRFTGRAFAWIGAVIVLLACLGVYGVIATGVAERVRDIGIRRALGAPSHRVVTGVIAPAVRLLAIGCSVGVLCGLGVIQTLRSEFFGLGHVEPLVLGSAVAVLSLTLLIAAWAPARRALRIDPMTAIKSD